MSARVSKESKDDDWSNKFTDKKKWIKIKAKNTYMKKILDEPFAYIAFTFSIPFNSMLIPLFDCLLLRSTWIEESVNNKHTQWDLFRIFSDSITVNSHSWKCRTTTIYMYFPFIRFWKKKMSIWCVEFFFGCRSDDFLFTIYTELHPFNNWQHIRCIRCSLIFYLSDTNLPHHSITNEKKTGNETRRN